MPFTVTIPSEPLPVDPGASATLMIEIVNPGQTTEPCEIAIEGIDPEWTAIPQAEVTVAAGRPERALVLIRPPKAAESAAGDYPFVVRVRSMNDGEAHAATGILRIKAFHHIALEITPRKGSVSPISRDNHFELVAMNLGNAEHTLQLSGSDPEDACAYEFENENLTVGPGQQREVELIVNPRRRSAFSSSRLVGFTTTARSVDAPTVVATTQAQLEVRPLLSPALLATLVALIALIGTLWALRPPTPTLSLRVSKPNGVQGDRVTVSWEAQGAKTVDLFVGGAQSADLPAIGSQEVELVDVGTLTIRAIAEQNGRRGEEQVVNVSVTKPPVVPEPKILLLKPSVTTVRVGQSFVLEYGFSPEVTSAKIEPLAKDLDLGLNSLQIDTDTPGSIKYTVVALNKDGKRVSKSFTIDVIDPAQSSIVDFTVSPKEVEANSSVTIRWSVTGAAAVRLEYAGQAQDLGSQSGTIEVPISAKTTFTLRAVDSRGKAVTKSGTVNVKAPPEPPVLPEDGNDPTNETTTTGTVSPPTNAP